MGNILTLYQEPRNKEGQQIRVTAQREYRGQHTLPCQFVFEGFGYRYNGCARFQEMVQNWFGGWRDALALSMIPSELHSCSKGFSERISVA